MEKIQAGTVWRAISVGNAPVVVLAGPFGGADVDEYVAAPLYTGREAGFVQTADMASITYDGQAAFAALWNTRPMVANDLVGPIGTVRDTAALQDRYWAWMSEEVQPFDGIFNPWTRRRARTFRKAEARRWEEASKSAEAARSGDEIDGNGEGKLSGTADVLAEDIAIVFAQASADDWRVAEFRQTFVSRSAFTCTSLVEDELVPLPSLLVRDGSRIILFDLNYGYPLAGPETLSPLGEHAALLEAFSAGAHGSLKIVSRHISTDSQPLGPGQKARVGARTFEGAA